MDSGHSILINKFDNQEAVIGIVGLGYVGLPLLIRYAEVGFRVIGIDIDETKVNALNQQRSYIAHIDDSRLKAISENYQATTDFSVIKEIDAIILCVPTPLNKYREPDLTFVLETMDAISPYLRKAQVLSLESTTYPGTTEEELQPKIEKQGLSVGKDFYLVYSPEREDPGNANFNTASIPKICGGVSEACLNVGLALYQGVISKVVPVSSTKAAEMTKLLENIHRAVNIGLVNEMKLVADKMGIDIYEVIDAASTKPFGFVPYYPGPGIGGHCIPIDPFYLTWKAREFGLHTRFIELAGEINGAMPKRVVHKIGKALNERDRALKGSKLLILGVAYKKDVDDMRESPALPIIERLEGLGAKVSYHDPHVLTMPKMRHHQIDKKSISLNQETISQFDAVIVITAHSQVNYDLVFSHAKLIIDTRGAYRSIKNEKLVRA